MRKVYEVHGQEGRCARTEKRDLFTIERLDNNRLRVRAYNTNKDAEKEGMYYDRTFLASETKEIILYGMDGNDFLSI
ncbi:hypothetical protein D5R40_30850 [Okeania hirsuta]|uniref:Uncharacterized protein n=1 Tax=Okeania hirsuta TaxID=1458930 RepID=A0A3N6PZG9_9CYAN|nr:hypothetical protein [Okeania hirsuta]RQH22488.1 hypothetical protein D5R40_30850 [Okeania hirsuta]